MKLFSNLPSHSSRIAVITLLLTLAAGTISALTLVPYQIDDAFITYRYVSHFTEGLGIVFNAGAIPTEGFSSPIWFILLSLFKSILGDAPLPVISTVLGLFSLIFLGGIVYYSTYRKSELPILSGTVSGLLVMLLPVNRFYSVTGLEQTFFTLIIVSVTLIMAGGKMNLFKGGLLLVSPWARPESPWLLISGYVQDFFSPQTRRVWFLPSKDSTMKLIAIFTGYCLLLLVRYLVFSDFFPNTYYAKQPSLSRGAIYFFQAVTTPWVALIVVMGIAGGLTGNRFHKKMMVAALAWFIVPVLEGGDIMPAYRFFSPALTLFILSAAGLFSMKRLRLAGAFLFILALLFSLMENSELTCTAKSTMATIGKEEDLRIEWLQQSNAGSIALMDIGRLGYKTDLKIFDLGGLTDYRLARSGGGISEKVDLDYFHEFSPDVVFIRSEQLPGGTKGFALTSDVFEAAIMSDEAFRQNYKLEFIMAPDYERSVLYAVLVFSRADANIRSKFSGFEIKPFNGLPYVFISD